MPFTRKTVEQSVKCLSRHTLYRGYHQVEQLSLQHRLFQGGWIAPIQREVITRKDVVGVLLVDLDSEKLVFIEQFRAGVFLRQQDNERENTSPWLLEIVAGDVESGESVSTVAYRETKEETSLAIHTLLPVCEYFLSPTNHSGKIHLFIGIIDATQANMQKSHGIASEGEDIRIQTIDIHKALHLLKTGKIMYAPAIIALQYFQLNREQISLKWNSIKKRD